jgi:Fe-Mn family superoxide dismutase
VQVVNHTFFWEGMAPGKGGQPSGKLGEAIARDFGSFEAFAEAFKTAGATQFGSGWAWLSVAGPGGKLEVSKTPNAENPWVHGKTPILTMDVWEHAYYIGYFNARPGEPPQPQPQLQPGRWARACCPDCIAARRGERNGIMHGALL